ncbi:type VII secretion protein EccE [Mycobacterium sp. TY815]|uniref:type VII secretion protein EccE n=1 Tax=Mycobacterium sp. TY815 TaxID=3050581 RepID=UPI0027409C8D|nr:type VII secretion protein EccE [Mycobacterium sp. TY815]MDP7707373.1 type VII secretion protein EccE [Mycobacterium sp. TY815]
MTVTVEDETDAQAGAGDQTARSMAQVTALRGWGCNLSLRRVMIGESLGLAAIAALAALTPWFALIPVILACLVFATATFRGSTATQWASRGLRVSLAARRSPMRVARATIPAPFSVELHGVGPIGMRWDGHYAITMIALYGREFAQTVLVSEGVDTLDTLPLQACAALMEQFGGLELHSIDVVSDGARMAPDGWFTARYDEIIGDRSAVGMRRSWLILRLRPQACLQAIAYRGSVANAAAAATERIRQALVRAGCRSLICNPEQFNRAQSTLLDSHDLDAFEEHWTDLQVGDDYVSVYRVEGADLNTRLLNDLWTIRSRKTVILVRLTRENTGTAPHIGALVRLHTASPQPHPPISTLHSVAGQALYALMASLPLGDRAVQLELSTRPLAGRELQIPIGPSGFLHGMAERAGVPVLLAWNDPLRFIRVAIAAHLDVVQSLVLRATAAGAIAEIHTQRPQVWKPICDDVRIILAQSHQRSEDATLIIADGPLAQQRLAASGEKGHALVCVATEGALTFDDADITIQQSTPGRLTIGTPYSPEITLAIMRPRNESQSLAHLRSSGSQQ